MSEDHERTGVAEEVETASGAQAPAQAAGVDPAGVHSAGGLTQPDPADMGLRPLPAWLGQRWSYERVGAFGRAWPRAGWFERAFWAVSLLVALAVLGLAGLYLKPDARGVGTHEQLGLPPCGFVEMLGGLPCPSCGYTTTFTLAAHARPLDAFQNQPFGFFLFVLTVLMVPLIAFALVRGVSLFALTERWPWVKLLVALGALWLAAWGYKYWLMVH